MNEFLRRVHIPDLLFFTLVTVLTSLGLIMVYSSSSVTALDRFGESTFYLKRQAVFVLAGYVTMFMVLASDYHRWTRMGGWILLATFAILGAMFIPGVGHRAGGALRWISFGGFSFQPAEFAKISCILYMTWALVRKGNNVTSFTYGLLPMGLVAGMLAGLLLLQPDFGNAVVLVLIAGILMFLAGCRLSYLLGVILWSLPVVWILIMGSEYRRNRMLSCLDPWADPQNTSYQILQSFTAFYSGGLWGTGLGNSKEKLYYLPEVHTDFIGAVVGEELGFIGLTLMVLCFLVLVLRGFRIAMRASDPTGFLLAAGCTSLLGLQAMLNLFVIMGLAPTKGLPLPFISHGGSSLFVSLIACGLIQSVARHSNNLVGKAPHYPWLSRWGQKI